MTIERLELGEANAFVEQRTTPWNANGRGPWWLKALGGGMGERKPFIATPARIDVSSTTDK